jgi:hypothetical protein
LKASKQTKPEKKMNTKTVTTITTKIQMTFADGTVEVIDNNVEYSSIQEAMKDLNRARRAQANDPGLAAREVQIDFVDWTTMQSTFIDWSAVLAAVDLDTPAPQAEPIEIAPQEDVVEFYWDYEDTGPVLVQSCYVDGIEIDGLHEYLQDCGLAAARKLVKKLAKQAGKKFKEVTDAGMAADYARDRIIKWNQYERV